MNEYNNPPKVPVGWSRRMADFVWNDWLDCLGGKWKSVVPERVAKSATGVPGLWFHPSSLSEGSYFPWWTTPEARIAAWAAVGAPVIATSSEGDK